MHHRLAFLLLSTTFFVVTVVNGKDFESPPSQGDGPDYDMIAVHLVNGEGFSRGVLAEALLPYQQTENPEAYWFLQEAPIGDFARMKEEAGPTSYRPPLLPTVIATGYGFFGRDFRILRILNAIFVALSMTLVMDLAWRVVGTRAVWILALLTAFLAPELQWAARSYLTEALSCFFVACLAWVFSRLDAQTPKAAILVGGTVALAILNRSIMIIWLPVIVLALAWRAIQKIPGRPWLPALRFPALVGITCLAVLLPWWIRNVCVTGAFMPMGTQGGINLPAQYSDDAVELRGRWSSLSAKNFFEPAATEPGGIPARQEAARADYGKKVALAWIAANFEKVPSLMFWRIAQEYWPRKSSRTLVQILALVGAFMGWRRKEVRILVGLIALNAVGIALTHSVGGRFIFPVLPLTLSLASIGLSLGSLSMARGNTPSTLSPLLIQHEEESAD